MTDEELIKRLRASRAVWEDGKSHPTDDETAAADRIEVLIGKLREAALIIRREIVRTEAIHPEMDDRKRVVTLRAVTEEYADIEKEILGLLHGEEVPSNLSE